MKYRLDTQHYYQDKLIEPGTMVGDDTEFSWRDAKGSPIAPSLNMTPMDDEAKRLYRDKHNSTTPERDPTKSIPIQGTGDKLKVQPPGVPRPGSSPQATHEALVKAATPAPINVPAAKPSP